MTPPRAAPLLLLIAAAAVVGGAWGFQLIGGLAPCELCLYQRWPYYAVIAASLVALAVGRRGTARALLAFAALAFLLGAGLALYHVGVEQHWIAGPTACTGTGAANSIDDLRRRLLAQQVVQCDEVQWRLFGVSLAGWNVLISLGLAFASLAALRRPGLWRHA